jgi:hypothetical protein
VLERNLLSSYLYIYCLQIDEDMEHRLEKLKQEQEERVSFSQPEEGVIERRSEKGVKVDLKSQNEEGRRWANYFSVVCDLG